MNNRKDGYMNLTYKHMKKTVNITKKNCVSYSRTLSNSFLHLLAIY